MKKSSDKFSDIEIVLLQTTMFQIGIIPIENDKMDMRVPLNKLSEEESRSAKRKFRKLWRKAAKATIDNGNTSEVQRKAAEQEFGLGKLKPSRQQKNARKRLVFQSLYKETIEPILKNFTNFKS